MKSKMAVACALMLLSTGSFAQPYGGGPGGPGPGAGPRGPGNSATAPSGGPGGMKGGGPRAPRFGTNNTMGWSMMSSGERDTYRNHMMSAKSLEECQALVAEHRKLMEQRAKERNTAAPRGPRSDMCDTMRQRGFFQ